MSKIKLFIVINLLSKISKRKRTIDYDSDGDKENIIDFKKKRIMFYVLCKCLEAFTIEYYICGNSIVWF